MQHHGINFAILLFGDQAERKHPSRLRHCGAVGENIVIHLADDIDISRGNTIVKSSEEPIQSNQIKSWVCWLDNTPLQQGKTYLLQHRFNNVRAKIQSIEQLWDIHNWELNDGNEIKLNDIGQIILKTNQPLFYDTFKNNVHTGNAILIDETTNNTVAALMFLD